MKKKMILGEVHGFCDDGHVKICIGKTGHQSQVLLNGKRLENVKSAVIVIRAQQATTVHLEMYLFGKAEAPA